jgi:hypothetical protein
MAKGRKRQSDEYTSDDVVEHLLAYDESQDVENLEYQEQEIRQHPRWRLALVSLTDLNVPPAEPGWPDEWTVEQYLDMSPATVPAIILVPARPDRYFYRGAPYDILDGRHRVAVAEQRSLEGHLAFFPV